MNHVSLENRYGLPYWLDLERPVFPALAQNLTTDVAIIGAGITGLKLAHYLARYGFNITILEGGRVGDGASTRNQGSMNHGPNLSYPEAIQRYSREVARELWQMGLENQRLAQAQMAEYEIECDYQETGFHFLVRRDVAGWLEQLENYQTEYQLLHEDGFEVAWLDEPETVRRSGSPMLAGGLAYLSDAQFHSGKFLLGLAGGVARLNQVSLFEGARVEKIEPAGSALRLFTPAGVVTAEQVFLAIHALTPQLMPPLEKGLRAERGQVFVTEPLSERPCVGGFGATMAWWRDIPEPDGRFRLLFGGGRDRNRPETLQDSLFPQFTVDGQPHPSLEREGSSFAAAHQQRLEVEFAKLFPQLATVRLTHRWGGLQCFTADNLPIVGMFDPERRVHGIAGYCGRGNCHSDVAAEFLAGKAAGVKSEVEQRFGPLIEKLMAVGRNSANWGPWSSLYTEN